MVTGAVVSVSFMDQQQDARYLWPFLGLQSPVNNVIGQLWTLVYMDLQQFAILEMSCQLPVFGKLCYTTIAEGVRSISDNLYKSMRQWSLNLMIHVVFSGMLIINPKLTEAQQFQLMSVITRAMEQLLIQHSYDERLMKGIVTLACPDRGSCLLISYLIEVLRSLTSGKSSSQQQQVKDIEAGTKDETSVVISESINSSLLVDDAKAARILRQDFFIDRMYIAAMPPLVRRAILCALSRDVLAPPICCITLEPLVKMDGRIGVDVVAVIQCNSSSSSDSSPSGDLHAFLYKGSALFNWLGKRQLPMAPETRAVVRPMDIYRLSA